jgi:hypothetical protein
MYRTNAETPEKVIGRRIPNRFTGRLRSSLYSPRILLLTIIFGACAIFVTGQGLEITVSKAKLKPGESVEIVIRARERPKVVILEPTIGTRELELTKSSDGTFNARFQVGRNSPSGLYAVHAWTGEKRKPSWAGKASFRVGNIVTDFFIANYLDKDQPANDLDAYLKDLRAVGGNFLIAHNLIIPAGAFYPSKIAATTQGDIVELVLDRADRLGIPVLLSVGWDVTRQSPYKHRMREIKAIAAELFAMYHHHPSLVGFYSWQEGSGTYYAPFVREFSEHIKSLDRGLLTACAPHIDDPLLASYLSVIEELDIMIFQSAVMASYRPDNRKQYPLRRVRDFSGLGAGAKRLQNKIVLTHVELFAYMEKRLRPEILTASHSDIYGQILSAATVTDTDGIALFAYHSHIFDQSKRFDAGKTGRSAVEKGLKLYQTITSEFSAERNPIALYIPYSDFVIERWNNYFLPALDAFRRLGVPVDILPYAPRLDESVYPYYPIHMNEAVLERLLKERTVLALANVSGFQQTDSDLIKAFVERGGVVVAFGPQIPYGRTFERKDLFGGDKQLDRPRSQIGFSPSLAKTKSESYDFPSTNLPSWSADGASVLATYGDGTAAILSNKFGKGTVYTVLPDVSLAADQFPKLAHQVLNAALRSAGGNDLVEISGAERHMDFAATHAKGDMRIAIVSHDSLARKIKISKVNRDDQCSIQVDLGPAVPIRSEAPLDISVPSNGVLLVRCSREGTRGKV